MGTFWNPRNETMTRTEIEILQAERLRRIVRHVFERNDVWRERLEKARVAPDDIWGLDDLKRLPFMSKKEFREHYPLGMCCEEKHLIREMHMSSGTTGVPVVMPYTESDLKQWAHCMARCYVMAGGKAGDVVQIMPSLGLFNGGFGFYHGARLARLFALPTGAGNTPRQIKLARDFGTRIFGAVVSYATRLIEVLEEQKSEIPSLEIGIFGAEVFSDAMKEKIREGLRMEVFDIYGMTETGGIGTLGMDCTAHDGYHVWEDHYIVEIIDPDTGEQLKDGDRGELVVTALTREALPVIRFRTGDLTSVVSRAPCSCGRTHVRIAPVTGRVDDMLIVKGVNFFPSQIEQALMEIPGVKPHYQIILEEENGVTDVRVHVEAEESVTGYMVEKHLKEVLGFSPKGDVFKPGELPRSEGKAQRVVKVTK